MDVASDEEIERLSMDVAFNSLGLLPSNLIDIIVDSLDTIFYHMRKKAKYEPNIVVKFTTTNFVFRSKIDTLYHDFVKNGNDFSSIPEKHEVEEYIRGFYCDANVQWNKVNFYLEKGIAKLENDTLPIKMVDELPQQTQCDCGAFVCAFAEYVIHGIDIPKEIDINHVHISRVCGGSVVPEPRIDPDRGAGEKPLQIFGCPTYAHVDNGNLEATSVKCLFMGYKPGVKVYKYWCPKNRKVIISRYVVFDETAIFWAASDSSASPPDEHSDMNQQHTCYIDSSFMYLLLYIDDILIVAKDMREIIKVKAYLSKEFEIKDLGATKKIHVMEIMRDRHKFKLYLSQKRYIEKVLHRFNVQNDKPVGTPLAAHFKISAMLSTNTDNESDYMS
ncbi:hypothetical protein FXO38_15954 [Capsicum annuum]|uniref:Reverse transcriptase Ty1/copia-type domain-containing protein n=1 Tax=Capsicum annuum TaxID=4072 RepID=A0A2G2Y3H0_CAPAN|nr:hypothetical protein FXO38_15954 [Capsicum annuum]KAF3669146.1 hypothetical protein FXO37_09190 [Capsicum annuum]PHT64295.1 hypothetical protein T459_31822 [Capsicum annuum]